MKRKLKKKNEIFPFLEFPVLYKTAGENKQGNKISLFYEKFHQRVKSLIWEYITEQLKEWGGKHNWPRELPLKQKRERRRGSREKITEN